MQTTWTRTRQQLVRCGRRSWRVVRALVLAVATPLLEKNPRKSRGNRRVDVPLVLSMARLVVLMFAVALTGQITRAGVAGWPEATLAMTIVLAVPLVNALERMTAGEAVGLAKAVVARFGEGATRTMGSVYPLEPSKWDDHREDRANGTTRGRG